MRRPTREIGPLVWSTYADEDGRPYTGASYRHIEARIHQSDTTFDWTVEASLPDGMLAIVGSRPTFEEAIEAARNAMARLWAQPYT